MSLMSELYQSWGCCRVLEMGVSNLGRCDRRGWSYQLYSPGLGDWVEVGRVGEQGEYFSRRLMMKQLVQEELVNMWTVTGTVVNVTRLIGVLLELFQNKHGEVEFDQLFKTFS